MKAFNS